METHDRQRRTFSDRPLLKHHYVRTTVYLPKGLHRKLEAAAAAEDQEMSEVVAQLIEGWLKSKEG